MARKVKPPDALPSKAWLMSFGDTMTTLLAFFIVLCSMAEDQTGANLHTGTGSFIRTMKSAGLPGAFSGEKSSRAVQFEATNPLYMVGSDEGTGTGAGPDEEPNDISTKSREVDEFKRFLNELDRHSNVESKPDSVGEIAFDFFEPLSREPPYLPGDYEGVLARVAPFLRKATHQIELVIWAPTPSRSARSRVARQAASVVSAIIFERNLDSEQSRRIYGTGRTWPYRDVKRPVLTLVIRRVRLKVPTN